MLLSAAAWAPFVASLRG
ncbi:hypothetical protein ACH4UM_05325 [Streptomyces sp. NPDC020801]